MTLQHLLNSFLAKQLCRFLSYKLSLCLNIKDVNMIDEEAPVSNTDFV